MGSIQNKNPCTLGTQCSRYEAFGEPAMVSTRQSADGRCRECTRLRLKPNPALKEHEELFRAAGTLWSERVANGDIIIPTLAFAAQSQKRPILKNVRDRLSEVQEGSQAWQELRSWFIRSFGPLAPESVKNGTLFVKARPIAVLAWGPGGGVVQHITVDVYSQPRHAAGAEHVEEEYRRVLTTYNIPQSPYGLELHEVWYSDRLQIIVGPSHPRIYDLKLDDPNSGIGSVPWGGTFPPPSRVRDHYASALRGAKEGGFGDILVSRQKGEENKPYEPHNLIKACIAWYVGGYDVRPGQPDLPDETTNVVEEYFAALPNPPWPKAKSTIPRDLPKLSPAIRRIHDALQKVNYENLVRGFGGATEI